MGEVIIIPVIPYERRQEMTLTEMKPFSEGNAHEVVDNVVRIYDRTGFPRIEIWAAKGEDTDLDELASQIRGMLNLGPDWEGP